MTSRSTWDEVKARIESRYSTRTTPIRFDRNSIVLGRNETAAPVMLSERRRLEHGHVIGSIGSGKSTFLEHCIRQDISRGRGVCVLDPHGNHPDSLYRNLLCWLDARGYTKGRDNRVVHLIDPNAPHFTTGFNPLAPPSQQTGSAVIASVVLQAFERVWGDEDTRQKPTTRRILKATFAALAERGLTLAEADLLYDPYDRHGIRELVLSKLEDRYARTVIRELHMMAQEERSKRDFRAEVLGPINRLAEFVSNPAIRTIIGQQKNALDIGKALDEGHIILVNLAGGDRVESDEAQILGRLITRMMLFHAMRRKTKPIVPYWLYLDECHLYLSGDVQLMLAAVRKYGLGCVLSHQYLAQLGAPDDELRAAVRNVTKCKAVFNISDHIDAEELAQTVLSLDLEMPVKASARMTPVGQRLIDLKSRSTGRMHNNTVLRSDTVAETEVFAENVTAQRAVTDAEGASTQMTDVTGSSDGLSDMTVTGIGTGTTTTDVMLPNAGWSGTPIVVATSVGNTASAQSSRARGRNANRNRALGYANGRNSMRAETAGWAYGASYARGHMNAHTDGRAQSEGASETEGSHQAFETVYELLPSSFHSKDNVLYMASQMLRCLNVGAAYIRYFDHDGAYQAFLRVPKPTEYTLPDDAFAELRDRVMAASGSAQPIASAQAELAAREDRLIWEADTMRNGVEAEPTTFRVKAPRAAPEPGRSRPAAAGRRRPRRSTPAAEAAE